MTLRVLLTHNSEDLEAYYARALPGLAALGVEIRHNPFDRDLTTPELIEHAAGTEVIIAHRSTPGDAELFVERPELRAFLRTAVDISTIDVAAATAHGVIVGHADKSFVASTAELALGLLIDTARHITTSGHDYRSNREPWQRSGRQLRGMTAGIIGYGAIGSYLADLLLAVGLEVIVSEQEAEVPDRFRTVDLETLLAHSDAVFPLVASTPATHHLIDADAIGRMRSGAVLINVSRGEIVDETAIETALDEGQLGGFGCDVGSAPDQRPNPRLAARPDVVATPHLGGLTPENADAQARSSVEQVDAILRGERPPRLANPQAWTHS